MAVDITKDMLALFSTSLVLAWVPAAAQGPMGPGGGAGASPPPRTAPPMAPPPPPAFIPNQPTGMQPGAPFSGAQPSPNLPGRVSGTDGNDTVFSNNGGGAKVGKGGNDTVDSGGGNDELRRRSGAPMRYSDEQSDDEFFGDDDFWGPSKFW